MSRDKPAATHFASIVLIGIFLLMSGCRRSNNNQSATQEITVAAAANLTEAFAEVSTQFTAQESIRVVYSFGATADLTKQIENGGPFDVFASADIEHIDTLDRQGLIAPGSRAVYARGQLVLWVPPQSQATIDRVEDIAGSGVKTVAIAKPDLAPYGRATVEALEALNIWSQVEPKVVYGPSVTTTRQYALSGNADAAFIPLALVKRAEGRYILIEERLHQPIDQALAIIKASEKQDSARRFTDFVLGATGQAILQQYGYASPMSKGD